MEQTTALEVVPTRLPAHRSPQQLAARLEELKQERGLMAAFFKDVMVEGHDYGIIPGTEKPTLFKPGAEKLTELYGYAPVVKDVPREVIDYATGFYRCVVTMQLISKQTGEIVAEGVGECNTREGRYFYRWVGDRQLPPGLDKTTLVSRERDGKFGKYKQYRLENDDPFTLWNTVLKMAKKRALVDATLSATRSSGLFSQSLEELNDWIEGEFAETEETAAASAPVQASPARQEAVQRPAAPKPAEAPAGPDADTLNSIQGRYAEIMHTWAKADQLRVHADLKQTFPEAWAGSTFSPRSMPAASAVELLNYLKRLVPQPGDEPSTVEEPDDIPFDYGPGAQAPQQPGLGVEAAAGRKVH